MASYNELLALIDAYINQNGVQAITGQVLNGVLRAMVDQLGRGYTIMGTADPTTDPGTPDGPESWFASTPGTYTNFDGLTVANAELALLSYTPSDGFSKTTLTQGIVSTAATVDNNVGTPSVTSSYVNGVLTFTFQNLKGNTGDPAGFGTVSASVDGNIGTPGVQVQTSGPDTAKNMVFQFTNLKGETGVTSVVATVDNTSGNPQCAVSLNGQQLTLAFTGLKGAQGDTGSSVDYPFTIVNNLTTNDATQALSAAMGVQLESEVSQLEAEVTTLSGKCYGIFDDSTDLPDDADRQGYAFVGTEEPLTLFEFDGEEWTNTGIHIFGIVGPPGPQGEPGTQGIQGPPGITSAVASVDDGTGVPSVEASLNAGVLTLVFHNLKGLQGNPGSSVDYAFTLVNNLITDDSTKALTASMGKYLQDEIEGMTLEVTDADLDIADEAGNILVQFKDGEIKTKNFNSEGVNTKLATIEEGAEVNEVGTMDADNGDYMIADENGKIIALFKDGHIKTKLFDSKKAPNKMRILGIGNSYTCDAFNYVGPILAEVLSDHQIELHIGICYQGGATLQDHYNNLSNNANYTFYEWKNNGPSWAKSTKAINTILNLDEWDVIFLQQGVYTSDDYTTYQPYLNSSFDMISERINHTAKFGFNLVRALSTDSSVFPDYIANAQKLLRETLVQFVIPCGTACQNARTTSLDSLGDGGHMTYDGFHLQDGLPCLVESYSATLFVLSIFGFQYKGINGSTFRPTQTWTDANGMNGQANGSCTGVTDANVVLAKKCATVAVNNPFVVTDCSNLF